MPASCLSEPTKTDRSPHRPGMSEELRWGEGPALEDHLPEQALPLLLATLAKGKHSLCVNGRPIALWHKRSFRRELLLGCRADRLPVRCCPPASEPSRFLTLLPHAPSRKAHGSAVTSSVTVLKLMLQGCSVCDADAQVLTSPVCPALLRPVQAGHEAHDAPQEACVHSGGASAPCTAPGCAAYPCGDFGTSLPRTFQDVSLQSAGRVVCVSAYVFTPVCFTPLCSKPSCLSSDVWLCSSPSSGALRRRRGHDGRSGRHGGPR